MRVPQLFPLATLSLLICTTAEAASQRQPFKPTATHVYKRVGDLELKLDIYQHKAEGAPIVPTPTIVWFHGGGMINGSRAGINPVMLDAFVNEGYVVASVGYRLAPETKIQAILEDVRDAWHWVATQGPRQAGVDPKRMAAAGGSAGGYLALVCGYHVEPKPRAIIDRFGYGDMTAPFFADPMPLTPGKQAVTEAQARAQVGTQETATPLEGQRRSTFYRYCRQSGRWAHEVAGLDPRSQADELKKYCPLFQVSPTFAPTILIHGEKDEAVPISEAERMVAALEAAGVDHELIRVPNAGHGLKGASAEDHNRVLERIRLFLREHFEL